MKDLYQIFWVETGWAKMSMKQRFAAIYAGLSFALFIASVESHFLFVAIVLLNLIISVWVVRKTKFPDMED